MTDNPTHPGLGESTDISAKDLDTDAEVAPPAHLDPEQRKDDDLGAGDGVDVQPGGAG